MGLYKSQKEILDGVDYSDLIAVMYTRDVIVWFGRRTLCLHTFLKVRWRTYC